MVGVYTPTLALNTESVATFITTCYLKKANKTQITPPFFLWSFQRVPKRTVKRLAELIINPEL